jgi:hypothetical protein
MNMKNTGIEFHDILNPTGIKKRWELVAEVVWLHHMKNTENFYTD